MRSLEANASHGAWATLTGLAGGVALTVGAATASPLLAVGALVGAVGATVLLLTPSLAFLATTFVIPIERLGRLTPDSAMYTISLMRILGVIALGSFLLHATLRRWRIHVDPPFVLYAIYFGIAVLGVTHTTDPLGTVRACGALLGNMLFFFLVVNMVRDWHMAQRAVQVWLASTVLICVYTIYTWHFGGGFAEADVGDTSNRFSTVLEDTSEYEALDTVARATGPTSHSAVYGMNLILTIPFFFFLLRQARGPWARVALSAALGLVLYNVLLTNTRAAILLAGLVVVLCAASGLLRVTAGMLVAGMVAVIAMLPAVPQDVYDRVLDPSNYSLERAGTLRIRLQYWEAGMEVVRQHWLTGIGVGNQQEIPKYVKGDAPAETTVHNEYLMTFMEVGIFGWLVFFGFVALVTSAAALAARELRLAEGRGTKYWFMVACVISMLSVLMFGVQVDVFHFPLKGWWLVAGLSWVVFWRLTRGAARAPAVAAAGGAH